MAKEFKTRKAIEKEAYLFNMPWMNALILLGIAFMLVFTFFKGFSVRKIIVSFSVLVFSYFILTIITPDKIRAFRKKYFINKVVIRINSYKLFK